MLLRYFFVRRAVSSDAAVYGVSLLPGGDAIADANEATLVAADISP